MEYENTDFETEAQQIETEETDDERQPEEQKPHFETLKIDNDYEITTSIYPYIIRRKSTHKIVSVWKNNKGYNYIDLNGKKYRYHRVIALQFIPNPDNLKEVDHINHNKLDNRLSNLRWVSNSINQRNKTVYNGVKVNYVDELSNDAISVDEYNGYKLEFYYFDNNKFYYYTGEAYRELYYNIDKNNEAKYVWIRDIDNKRVKICLNKFKKLHDLI